MNKKNILSILPAILLFIAASSAQPGMVRPGQKFVANLSGEQVVPRNNSSAKAVCKLVLNPQETGLNVECNYAGLSGAPTAITINAAPLGQNGNPVLGTPFLPSGTSGGFGFGFFSGGGPLGFDVRSNKLYFNFSTAAFPNGEIRGQIMLANGNYNDFDGDSRADLAVYRSSSANYYSLNSLTGNLGARNFGASGGSASLNADFDGDGRADYTITRTNAGQITWHIFQSETNTLRTQDWGNTSLGDFFASADYDGDGKFDLGVFRSGAWYILESSTGNMRSEFFGQFADAPAPNDFDKDGKWDLCVARSEGGQRVWYIRKSTTGESERIEWGISSDPIFIGRTDFDGDSAADILVIRNINGQRNFLIRRSSDSQLQVIPWGLPNDLPKLADYDGDGKTDPTVNRNVGTEKNWYILNSSNSQLRYEVFGISSDF